jgi:PRTRC genetic system protein C
MEVSSIPRKFKVKIGTKDKVLTDPDPKLSIQQVKDFYGLQYPEILNSNISNEKVIDDELIIEFSSKFGGKG